MLYENKFASSDTVVRDLSALLFSDVKPACVDLLNLSNASTLDTSKINWLLTDLWGRLESHYLLHSQGLYRVSSNLADYIFVPLSNLFKHEHLDDAIILSTLKIMSFLWRHSWSSDHVPEFVDQYYAFILFLAGCRKNACEIGCRLSEYKLDSVSAVSVLISSLPVNYFGDKLCPTRMLFLGDTITLLLTVVCSSSGKLSDLHVALNALHELHVLSRTFMTSEQISQVLPGISSQLISFGLKNTSTHCHIMIMRVLRECICRSFNDDDLSVSVSPVVSDPNLVKLTKVQPVSHKLHGIKISVNSNSMARTESWLRATSKQLKLALIPFFKTLTSSQFYAKIATNVTLQEEVVLFFKRIMKVCFVSLFNDFASLAIDVYALLIAIVWSNDQYRGGMLMAELVEVVSHNYGAIVDSRQKSQLTLDLVDMKINDLLEEKFKIVILITNEEKMHFFFVAVTFQLVVYHSVANALLLKNDSFCKLRGRFLRLLASYLAQSVDSHYSNLNRKNFSAQHPQLLPAPSGQLANKLDDIELPLHINARQISATVSKSRVVVSSYSTSLLLLANKLEKDGGLAEVNPDHVLRMFPQILSGKVERLIEHCVLQLSRLEIASDQSIQEFESLLASDPNTTMNTRAAALWIANITLNKFSEDQGFDLDDIMMFSDDKNGLDLTDKQEVFFLIMNRSQDLLVEAVDLHKLGASDTESTMAYVAAIQSVGNISSCMPLAEFQQDIMIEYLYPLLEALTLGGRPNVQAQACKTLQTIVNNYYDGSIKQLLLDNLDYLIDSISLRLLDPTGLTPSVLGILVILIKVAGSQLLVSNQVNDVITEMFIVIDLFHGYPQLVESFFFVFEELLMQIRQSYPIRKPIEDENSTAAYSPWGLTDMSLLAVLVDDSARVFKPLDDYDPSREYFTRKPGASFEDQMGDSDDEGDEELPSQEEIWTCLVPQQTYLLAQRIFNYGYLMLQHLSDSLKVQVLRTLYQCYPILCSNYKLVPLVIAQNWLVLLALMSGKDTLSENVVGQSHSDNVIQAAMRLASIIVEEDGRHREQFMSRRFYELCEFLFANARAFKPRATTSTQLNAGYNAVTSKSVYANPKTSALYVQYILAGLSIYGRAIPDIVKYRMVEACIKLGIPENAILSQDAENIRYVILHGIRAAQS